MEVMNGQRQTFDGRIWTGHSGEIIPKGRLVIENGKILRVGPIESFSFEPEGQYCDYSGRTIIPGLIDTHTHPIFGEEGRRYEDYIREDSHHMMLLRASRNVKLHQAIGVTTLRDSGSVGNVGIALREGIRTGYVTGPRVLTSASPITITGGHFWWCHGEADGVEGVRRAVRKRKKQGVDFIKIMASGGGTLGTDPRVASFTQAELDELVRESHAHGLRCSAHAEATEAVKRAVKAGVGSIEHAGFQEPDGTRTYREDIVEMMVEKDLVYSPTIQTAFRQFESASNGESNPTCKRLKRQSAHYKLSRKLDNLTKMHQAGVTIIAGSDAIRQFGDFVLGLELFVYAGMTAEEALQSATSGAAFAIGLEKVTGALRPGLAADLLVVEGDPLEDIRDLRNVVAVFQGGEQVFISPRIKALIPDSERPGANTNIAKVLDITESG